MAKLPTGTVTLLFSDIEGSTKLLHRAGDSSYHERLRYDFERWGGTVEKFSQSASPTASRLARLCPLRKTSM